MWLPYYFPGCFAWHDKEIRGVSFSVRRLVSSCSHDPASTKFQEEGWRNVLLELKQSRSRPMQNEGFTRYNNGSF